MKRTWPGCGNRCATAHTSLTPGSTGQHAKKHLAASPLLLETINTQSMWALHPTKFTQFCRDLYDYVPHHKALPDKSRQTSLLGAYSVGSHVSRPSPSSETKNAGRFGQLPGMPQGVPHHGEAQSAPLLCPQLPPHPAQSQLRLPVSARCWIARLLYHLYKRKGHAHNHNVLVKRPRLTRTCT